MNKRHAPKSASGSSSDSYIERLKSFFNEKEWEWFQSDENCRNVIAGRDYMASLFYLRFRVPRRLRRLAFLDD